MAAERAAVEVIEMGVGKKAGYATFDLNANAPTGAGVRAVDEGNNQAKISLCTLDEAIEVGADTPVLILIDIEGGELDALRGAANLIARQQPLIIFEYNETTRRYFELSQVRGLLGACYKLYRLRSEDGLLYEDLSLTWNVVALPQGGAWKSLNQHPGLIVQ